MALDDSQTARATKGALQWWRKFRNLFDTNHPANIVGHTTYCPWHSM